MFSGYRVQGTGYGKEGRLTMMLIALLAIGAVLAPREALANNVTVSNARVSEVYSASDIAVVQFDIAWENSWYLTDARKDAVWIFIKYSKDSGTTWRHATLAASGTNPSVTSPPYIAFGRGTGTALDIVVPTDKKGAFLQRSLTGGGRVSTTDIKFLWDYNADGLVDTAPGDTARIKVFAIEMTYIPTGAFYAGDQGTIPSINFRFTKTNINTSSAYPATVVGGTGVSLPNNPTSWPNGFDAFYLMKYEISQGQYADFLSTLNTTQALERYASVTYGTDRYTIAGSVNNMSAGASGEYADRACNYLSWADVAAYADWAGLRPMTELEFEKACRGSIDTTTPVDTVANEYAWGNTTITAAQTLSGSSYSTETAPDANCNYNNTLLSGMDGGRGPVRCGIFATASSVRYTSGAGYYGNMELSGNVWERVIGLISGGSPFIGTNGDGLLDASGNADIVDWPGNAAGSYGAYRRGGSWLSNSDSLITSYRNNAGDTVGDRLNTNDCGGRCARTA